MTAVADFTNDPLDFMQRNVVLVQVGGLSVPGPTGTFTLSKHTGPYKGKNLQGKSCSIYELHQAVNPLSFVAYWCQYANDAVHSVTAAAAASYLFTAKMDGCSFGVALPAVDGSVRVAHANSSNTPALNTLNDLIGNEQDLAIRASLQREKLTTKTAHQFDQLAEVMDYRVQKTLGPLEYADRGLKSTTFGLRDGTGAWTFYYHMYSIVGVTHSLRACLPIR